MVDIYTPEYLPEQYDAGFLYAELLRISASLASLEVPYIRLTPSASAPVKVFDGMVMNADGINWNPGSGAGLYERVGGAWNKL